MKNSLFTNAVRIIIGAVFIFSGIIKLFPIEVFEIEFIFNNGIPWAYTPIISRLLISIEVSLGLLIILNSWKKIVFPIAIGLIIGFSLLLIYQLFTIGNQENCGCFGTLFPFNTIESLLKNILILISLFFLLNKKEWFSKLKGLFVLVYICITIGLFLQYPIPDIRNFDKLEKMENNDASVFTTLNNNDFTKDEHLIIFMSLTCPHCKELSKKLSILNQVNKIPPIYIYFLNNKNKNVDDFFKTTSSNFPYSMLSIKEFLPITKGKMPSIYHIKNNKIIHHWTNKNFNPDVFIKK